MASALVLIACGKRGDPLPPLRPTPQPVTGLALLQRGKELTIRLVAPRAATDGTRLPVIDIELRRLEGEGDFQKEGVVSTRKAAPGERLEWNEALPPAGTELRLAAVALQGKKRSTQTPIVSLVVQPEPPAPSGLTVRSGAAGADLHWTAPEPMPMQYVAPTPAPLPSPPPRALPAPGLPPAGQPSGQPPSASGAQPSPMPVEPAVPTAPSGPVPTPGPPSDAGPAPASAPGASPSPEASPGPSPAASPAASPSPSPSPTPAPPRPGGFFVYRRTDPGSYGGALGATPVETASYADASASLGSNLCYVVRTVISTDPLIESQDSNEACVKVEDITAPAAPGGVTTLAVEDGIEVSWSPSPEADLLRYRVYRAVRGGGAPERLAELAKPTAVYRDSSAKSGQRYRYTVTAVDAAGNESPASPPAEGSWP